MKNFKNFLEILISDKVTYFGLEGSITAAFFATMSLFIGLIKSCNRCSSWSWNSVISQSCSTSSSSPWRKLHFGFWRFWFSTVTAKIKLSVALRLWPNDFYAFNSPMHTLTPLCAIESVLFAHSKLPWRHLRHDFPCGISMLALIEMISNIFDNRTLPSLNLGLILSSGLYWIRADIGYVL